MISSGVLGGAGGSPAPLGPAARHAAPRRRPGRPAERWRRTAAPRPRRRRRGRSPSPGAADALRRASCAVTRSSCSPPPAASMQHVANEIVTRTEQRGGVVASSNVSVAGAGGGAQLQPADPEPAAGVADRRALVARGGSLAQPGDDGHHRDLQRDRRRASPIIARGPRRCARSSRARRPRRRRTRSRRS